jgi:integrase
MAKITGRGIIEKDKRSPKTWKITHYLGEKDENGRYKRAPKRTVHGSKADAYKALEEYRKELEATSYMKPTKLTVGEYARRFHEQRDGEMRSPLSYQRERLDVEHIEQYFGDVGLKELTPDILRQRYAKIRKKGDLSEDGLYKMHSKLRQVLKTAYTDELILRNPCDMVHISRPVPAERKALSAEDAQRFYKELFTEDISAQILALVLLVMTGMRRGEVLGLTWKYVDLDGCRLYVAYQYASDKNLREPKSKQSRRWISFSQEVCTILEDWKAIQKDYMECYGLEQTDKTPVVNNDEGGFLDPSNFERWFRNFSVDHGFGKFTRDVRETNFKGKHIKRGKGYEGLTLHGLRHTQATLLIAAKADWKTVQQRLGHAQASTTMNIYAHAVGANDIEAADTISNILTQ